MKKLFLAILMVLITSPVWATDYYACNAAQAINGNSTWCTAAHRTGSCAGDATYTAYTSLTSSDTLHANGCTVTIPQSFVGTFVKITNKTDGTSTDGGGFTATTTGWTNTNTQLIANVETGGTTGPALVVTGTGNLNPAFTLGSSGTTVTVTGGSASAMFGVSDTHTVGTTVYYANLTAGTNVSAHGLYHGSAGTVVGYGTATAVNGNGYHAASSGTGTWNGDCVGSTVARYALGCNGSGAAITVTGNIIGTSLSTGAAGKIIWAPSDASKYVSFDGGGTPIFASQAPSKAKIEVGTYSVISTTGAYENGTLSAAGGGGAWGF